MEGPLSGCLILIAEDEPPIAFDITKAFEDEGATVISAGTLKQALRAPMTPPYLLPFSIMHWATAIAPRFTNA